jgi:hypothetical protein
MQWDTDTLREGVFQNQEKVEHVETKLSWSLLLHNSRNTYSKKSFEKIEMFTIGTQYVE